ncbi:hypothetical protein EDB84DRAFT_1559033 [Lactarius hengduanensis]|nr:hypothetical protein EDB84DRAFT_1559033 [Lactarius hengduanensis]
MVNWHDSVLVLRDYLALIKLNHSLAGIYIWETVFTMGFEAGRLTSHTLEHAILVWPAFIVFFVDTDGGKVPCQPLIVANYVRAQHRSASLLPIDATVSPTQALPYISWAFASLIIVIRVQVLFQHHTATQDTECTPLQHCDMESPYYHVVNCDRNIVGWSRAQYTKSNDGEGSVPPARQTCITLKTHRGLTNSIAVLVVDIVLLAAMLIGLLRHAHRSSTGIWYLLYQQSLAGIAEIPPVVFLILDLNDPWNEMFTGVAITILSIGAARMYRALSKRGSLTEYSSEPPRNSSGLPFSTFQSRDPYNVRSPMHFAPGGTMSRSEGTTTEAPVFVPADEIQVEFVPGASVTSLAVPSKTQSKDTAAYQTVQLRPG